jgi:dTDP-4-dehydrorhamnose 3,5-epimerase-like enzyme
MTTVHDCKTVFLQKIRSDSGNLTIIQGQKHIPFDIKRVYFINEVPEGDARGSHAHKNLRQLILATKGTFTLILDDGLDKRNILLSTEGAQWGILIEKGIWRELENFSKDAVCLVLASEDYNENDYIRDYDEFLIYKKCIQ